MNTKRQSGFTLLELLIVVSMIGVIASFSISLYLNLNNSRNKQKAADELVVVLNQARSYSLSQVKKCSGTLSSYEVRTNSSTNCYSLIVNCTGPDSSSTLDTKCLSGDITFSSCPGEGSLFRFPIQGGAATPACVRVNGVGGSYISISVDANGIITAQ